MVMISQRRPPDEWCVRSPPAHREREGRTGRRRQRPGTRGTHKHGQRKPKTGRGTKPRASQPAGRKRWRRRAPRDQGGAEEEDGDLRTGGAGRDLRRARHKPRRPTARHGDSRTPRANAVESDNVWGSRPVRGRAPCGNRGQVRARRRWLRGPRGASCHRGARYRMAQRTKCGCRPRPVAGRDD
jgi:hypothetical protein